MKTVTLTFHLEEDVTPSIFAMKIAVGCARSGALRPGESVSHEGVGWLVHEHKPFDVLGADKPILMPHVEQISI